MLWLSLSMGLDFSLRERYILLTPLQVHAEPLDHSACSPDCKMSLRLVEDRSGYNITLRASRNGTTLEAKTFHLRESL